MRQTRLQILHLPVPNLLTLLGRFHPARQPLPSRLLPAQHPVSDLHQRWQPMPTLQPILPPVRDPGLLGQYHNLPGLLTRLPAIPGPMPIRMPTGFLSSAECLSELFE